MAKALAPSTLKAYSYAWSLFNLFCIFMHVSVLPVSVPIVCAFIVHCFESHRHKLSTIRGISLVFNFMLDAKILALLVYFRLPQSVSY